LHPSVRQPINFTIDVGHTGKAFFWRIKGFEGKFLASQMDDQSGFVKCDDLDLAAYVNAPLPQHLSLEASLGANSQAVSKDSIKVSKGSFTLGKLPFNIAPLELERANDAARTNSLTATSHSGTNEITYQLIVPAQPWKIEQRLTATPPMTPEDILARVFYDKQFTELTEDDQQAVKKMKGSFGGWPPEEEDEENQ
jgi:hypothetical protein